MATADDVDDDDDVFSSALVSSEPGMMDVEEVADNSGKDGFKGSSEASSRPLERVVAAAAARFSSRGSSTWFQCSLHCFGVLPSICAAMAAQLENMLGHAPPLLPPVRILTSSADSAFAHYMIHMCVCFIIARHTHTHKTKTHASLLYIRSDQFPSLCDVYDIRYSLRASSRWIIAARRER